MDGNSVLGLRGRLAGVPLIILLLNMYIIYTLFI